jgi:hypothetical protein
MSVNKTELYHADIEFPIVVWKIIHEDGKNPYDVVEKIKKILEKYKNQNFRLTNEKSVYDSLIEFCNQSCENSNPRFEQCKVAQLNRSNCTSCPIWKFKNELYSILEIENLKGKKYVTYF